MGKRDEIVAAIESWPDLRLLPLKWDKGSRDPVFSTALCPKLTQKRADDPNAGCMYGILTMVWGR